MNASPTTTSKKRGRKTILDAKLQKQICALLRDANSIETAAQASGISPRTVYNWIERASEKGEEKFADFACSIARARAEAKRKLVKVLVDASALDWRSAAWILERGFCNEYGRATKPPPPPPPPPEEVEFSSEEFARLMDKINASEKQRSALNSE
jgi:transposase-like protein